MRYSEFPWSRKASFSPWLRRWVVSLSVVCLAVCSYAGDRSLPLHPTVPDTMPGSMELEVIPKPSEAKFQERVFKIGRSLIFAPGTETLGVGQAHLEWLLGPLNLQQRVESAGELAGKEAETLVVLGAANWRAAREVLPWLPEPLGEAVGRESYRLLTIPGTDDRPNVILAAGGGPSAEFYAIQTLRQITYRDGQASFVRVGEVRDSPAFSIRGNKRFAGWLAGFKANLINPAGLVLGIQNDIPFAYRFGEFHPISFPPKPPKDVIGVPAAIEGMLKITPEPSLTTNGSRPVVAFMMDDVEVTDAVTPEDREKYGGYFEAVRAAAVKSAEAVRGRNPEALFLFQPQFYFSHMRDFREGGERFRKAGGLTEGMGVYFNGAEVSSIFFPRDLVRDYVENLGGTDATPVVIYDTVFDNDESFFAVPPLAPETADYLRGFIPEMGNPINIATYYDMLWNPSGYDPSRSEILACRETMGLERWEDLHRATRAYEDTVLPPAHSVPREAALDRLWKSAATLSEATGKLAKIDAGELRGRVTLDPLYERKGRRMFGRFEMADFVLTRRVVTPAQIETLRNESLNAALKSFPEPDIALAVSFSADGFPGLPVVQAPKDASGRVIGPTNTSSGPGGRTAVAFPGFPGTGVQVDLGEPLTSEAGWSAAWWMRGANPERLNLIFSIFEDSTFQKRVTEAVTSELQAGFAANSAGRLFFGSGVVTPPDALLDGEWHHVVLSVTPEGERVCHVDGIEIVRAKIDKTPPALAGRTVVLGAAPAAESDLAGARRIIRSWQGMVTDIKATAEYVQKNKTTVENFFARRLSAVFVAGAAPWDFQNGGVSRSFVPDSRFPTADISLEAVHDPDAVLIRVRGSLNAQGVAPQTQIYLDPSTNRSMAMQLSVPASVPGKDETRDFVEEGVATTGSWGVFFSQANKPPQYNKFPIAWDWRRQVENGKYEVTFRVEKKSLREAIGGVELPPAIGLQAWAGTAGWNSFLIWRGRVDPATFGTLDLQLPEAAKPPSPEPTPQ